jgi:hypothetical protein
VNNGAQKEGQAQDQGEKLYEKECGAEYRGAPETLKRLRKVCQRKKGYSYGNPQLLVKFGREEKGWRY